jgi:hypothetical protein
VAVEAVKTYLLVQVVKVQMVLGVVTQQIEAAAVRDQ